MISGPNININSLVEYTTASPSRRTAIIQQIVLPPAFLFDTWYRPICRAAVSTIASRGKDTKDLDDLDLRLLNVDPQENDQKEMRLLNAHSAIELTKIFQYSQIPKHLDIRPLRGSSGYMKIKGVRVAVNPTNYLIHTDKRKKQNQFGIVNLRLSKSKNLSPEGKHLYCTILHWFGEDQLSSFGEFDPQLCYLVDAFGESLIRGPKCIDRRREALEASCLEIADRWDTVKRRVLEKKLISPATKYDFKKPTS